MSSDASLVLLAVALAVFVSLIANIASVAEVRRECESFGQTTLHDQKYICTKVEK